MEFPPGARRSRLAPAGERPVAGAPFPPGTGTGERAPPIIARAVDGTRGPAAPGARMVTRTGALPWWIARDQADDSARVPVPSPDVPASKTRGGGAVRTTSRGRPASQ
ncbi:hypothetical protein C1701_08400 [Actinoalloteichus sp. AHMU CJ021]|nr:hypothetical protein C1701_08400 [Actinoalloteichus sp. AHMU CJ021]